MKIITALLSRKGIREVLLPLFAYVLLLALLMPKVASPYLRALFFIYALFVFWIVWEDVLEKKLERSKPAGERKFFIGLLIGSAVFIVISRFILFVRFGEAPFGYDTGFYLNSIESTFEGGLAGHRAIRSLIWAPLLWLGIPKLYILHGLYVLFQFLLAGSVYMLARSLALSSRLAQSAVLLFLFAMSMPQFFGYWWMFYQMQFALALLIATLALIFRRSPLAILIAGFGIGIHPATFLPLVVGLAFFAVFDLLRAIVKWRPLRKETAFILALGAIALFTLRLIGTEFFLVYLRGPIADYGWFVSNYPVQLRYMTGLYIPLSLFKLANIYVLPFALIGVLLLGTYKFREKAAAAYKNVYGRIVIFAFILLASFTLSALPFVYQNRFLMVLDLAMMVFAAYALLYFFQALLSNRKGCVIIGLFLAGMFVYSSYTIWGQQPQLYADERREIENIAQIAEPDAYAMSTESLYTPWVSGFSGRATVDPGYLSWNLWNYEMWREFWYGGSDARRHELLNMYDRPLYIFVGKRVPQTVRYKKFIESDPYFEQLSPHVWWYDPRRISKEDIAAMYEKENPPTPVEIIPDEQTDAYLDNNEPNVDESVSDM